ncbi:MAG: alpha/beta hydrolase [Pseudomonadota bacterium]|nr:alpha/beta hydrolase [Pseudomonadota bacterium]
MTRPDPIQRLDASPGRLAWREDGPGDRIPPAPPLLLLQRFRGTLDDWDPAFIAALAARRRVIRFDSAAIGRSEGEVPATVEGMAALAAEVIDRLGLPQADVLGWSLGGVVAQQLALDFPDRVRRLIVAGSSPGGIQDGPPPHPRVREVMTRGANDEADFLFLFHPETESATAKGRASLRRIAGQPDRGPLTSAASALAQMQAIGAWQGVRHRLADLTQPVLVANGAHDVMLPAWRSYVLSQEAPDAKLILYPDAGHGFLFQEIEDFATQIDRFLA